MPAVTGRTKRLINVLYCARIAIVNNSCMKLSNSFFSSAFRFCRLNMCYDSLILHGCRSQPKREGFLAPRGSHCHTIEPLQSHFRLSYNDFYFSLLLVDRPSVQIWCQSYDYPTKSDTLLRSSYFSVTISLTFEVRLRIAFCIFPRPLHILI